MNNPWPSWLQNIYPEWLESVGYPQSGVGDQSDLKLILGAGEGGKWVGFINPGWYYHNNVEQYSFVNKSTQTASATGVGSITAAVSFRPSWGPILVNSASGQPYIEHHNSYQPGVYLGWNSFVSGLYYTTIPSGCVLAGMRDLTTLPMGSVASSGMVTNSKLFYYDYDNKKLYIRPKDGSNIEAWPDLLYSSPLLKFREAVIDKGGTATASYKGIQDITVYRGSQSWASSGYQYSNVITHGVTGVFPGDWLILEYYITKSFIVPAHNRIDYYTGTADTVTVYSEGSVPDTFRAMATSYGASGTIDFNPIYPNAYSAGYLFHANPASSITNYWTASNLNLFLDKEVICSDWNERPKISLFVTTDNGLPLPFYPITILTSGASAITYTSLTLTNGKGEAHAILNPYVGSSTFSATAIVGTLSKTVSGTIAASGFFVSSSKWINGGCSIVVSNDMGTRGAFRTFVGAHNIDGIPRNASNNKITITSALASEFYIDSDILTKTVDLHPNQNINNPTAIQEIGYVPQPGDKIVAVSGTAQSDIIEAP